MVALIPEARAARAEAGRLRGEATDLKCTLRRSAADSRAQLRSAQAQLRRTKARRDEPLPSPWSSLGWSYYAGPLTRVLVPLD